MPFGFGKRGWRRVAGISNAQRQASRAIGIPISREGRRRKWWWPLASGSDGAATEGSGASGCLVLIGLVVLATVFFASRTSPRSQSTGLASRSASASLHALASSQDEQPVNLSATEPKPPAPTSPTKPVEKPAASKPDEGVRGAGKLFAEKHLPSVLKSPKSASYPWDTITFERLRDLLDESGETAAIWLVRGAVDAKSAAGVDVRGWWEATLMKDGDSFLCLELTLDKKVVVASPSYLNAKGRQDSLWEEKAKAAKGKTATKPTSSKPGPVATAEDPTAQNERRAAGKLKQAKQLAEQGQRADAIEFLEEIIVKYPSTKAAGEAKDLLKKLRQ